MDGFRINPVFWKNRLLKLKIDNLTKYKMNLSIMINKTLTTYKNIRFPSRL
jgi:hypothetical protein